MKDVKNLPIGSTVYQIGTTRNGVMNGGMEFRVITGAIFTHPKVEGVAVLEHEPGFPYYCRVNQDFEEWSASLHDAAARVRERLLKIAAANMTALDAAVAKAKETP